MCKWTVIAVIGVMTLASVAQAEDFGTGFTYQGELELDGALVDGSCDFEFSLWDASGDPDPGSQVGNTIVRTVDVVDGCFSVELDFGPGAITGQARWLEIGVCCPSGGGPVTTLEPRQELTPTPHAVHAETADRVVTEDDPQVGTIVEGYHAKWDGIALVTSAIFEAALNVGIGTTEPAAKLDVAGDIAVDGSVVINAQGEWVGSPVGIGGVGTVLDYGTSTSSGTVIQPSELKICYGIVEIPPGDVVTISGLPFSSASSYTVIVSRETPTYASQAVTTHVVSGSTFTIHDFTYYSEVNWLAIGH